MVTDHVTTVWMAETLGIRNDLLETCASTRWALVRLELEKSQELLAIQRQLCQEMAWQRVELLARRAELRWLCTHRNTGYPLIGSQDPERVLRL